MIPGLGVSLCMEANETQKDFSEHYKFLVGMDPTSPGIRASHSCSRVIDPYGAY